MIRRSDEANLQKMAILWLNASGRAQVWNHKTGALRAKGRGGKQYPLRYGLGVGGADIVGLLRPSGRFFALECKARTGQSDAQKAWQKVVTESGGFYAVVRSMQDVILALEWASA